MNATPPTIKRRPISRRTFLDLAGKSLLALSGVLGFGGMLRYFRFETEPGTAATIDLGLAENYPPGSRTFIPEAQAFVLHTAVGFTALSAICPHLGCSVTAAGQEFNCPCHGSRFDSNGKEKQGPANEPLRQLSIEAGADGQLTLLTL
jgi:cytochrome b6-f complex iron-sulfur subunit